MYIRYIRRSAEFEVVFSLELCTVITLEGPVQCQLGDAIVTGIIGEIWPVQRSIFDQNYYPLDNKFTHGTDGVYVRREIQVNAEQIQYPQTVNLGENRGMLKPCVGDWLVVNSEGQQWVVADKVFTKTYFKVDPSKEGSR
jgi:hypothetical protein